MILDLITVGNALDSGEIMQQKHPARVPDYKNVTLVMGLVNLMWIFAVIWSYYGFAFVLVLAAVLNHLITRLDLKLARKHYFRP